MRVAILAAVISGLLWSLPTVAEAAGLIVECNTVTTSFEGKPTIENPCGIDDFFRQFVVVAQFAYGLIFVMATGLVIYGGFLFVTAGGQQERIATGKRVITGTVTGLVIT